MNATNTTEETTTDREPTFFSAVALAKAGYPVFPVKGKRPSVEGGFYAATTEPDRIAAWIVEGREDHDVAFATGLPSDVVVVEADTPEAYAWMEARYGPPTVRTRRGGHWYFRHPKNGKVASTALGDGLDRKADGGYVVAPPSTGKTWTNGMPERGELPVLPKLLARERPANGGRGAGGCPVGVDQQERAAGAVSRRVARLAQGKRHEHLKHLCAVLLRRGLTFEAAKRIGVAAWELVGEELAGRAPTEVPNTLRTTERALAEGRATGVPSLERITPGLYGELAAIFGWEAAPRADADRGDGRKETPGSVDPKAPKGHELTDLGNAERFIESHGCRVRWCSHLRDPLVWDGKRWAKDECGEVVKMAQRTARNIHHEAADVADKDEQRRISRWAVTYQSAARIKALLDMARPHLSVQMGNLDSDPWLLNCQNGTVDLRTGEMRDHDPEDLITRMAPVEYNPDATAPRFAEFLREVFCGDEGVIGFVKRLAGYSLTGDTRERVMAILWGGGKNGKTTLVEVFRNAMGDYARNTDVETLLLKKYAGVGNDVAALKGARFVSTAEVEKGRRLAESKVKTLTGNDTVTARFLFAEPFDFRPELKLWLSTNNKPEIRGTADAIWDRIRLVPFTRRFDGADQDRGLPAKLREELPGVLAWMVAGCLEWQREGLGEPEKVKAATEEYRTEQDALSAFIGECCVIDEGAWVRMKDLYASYSAWCEHSGETAETKRAFGRLLSDRGFEPDRGTGHAPIRRGIALLYEGPPPDGEGHAQGNSGYPERYPGEQNDPDEGGGFARARVTEHPESYPRVTPQKPCKTEKNGEKSYPSYPKNQNFCPTPPREETFWKQGNYGNYGNSEPPEKPDVNGGVRDPLAHRGTDKARFFAGEDANDGIGGWLADPPGWFVQQARVCRADGCPERLVKPLASAVAVEVFGTATRWGEALPHVEAKLREADA